jgi:hypothetical protein
MEPAISSRLRPNETSQLGLNPGSVAGLRCVLVPRFAEPIALADGGKLSTQREPSPISAKAIPKSNHEMPGRPDGCGTANECCRAWPVEFARIATLQAIDRHPHPPPLRRRPFPTLSIMMRSTLRSFADRLRRQPFLQRYRFL